MRTVELHPAAEAEGERAAQKYRRERAGLDDEFFQAIDEGLAAIEADFETGHTFDARHRFVLTRKFPYVIYFRSEATVTLVVAIAHEGQKPGYWRPRE